MKFRSKESYPGQHGDIAARELLTELVAGPLAIRGLEGKERDWCEEEALRMIRRYFSEVFDV